MKHYTAISRDDQPICLYTDDTFTLAMGSPDTESIETTPQMLFELFDSVAIAGLLEACPRHGDEEEKLMKAWALGDMPNHDNTLPTPDTQRTKSNVGNQADNTLCSALNVSAAASGKGHGWTSTERTLAGRVLNLQRALEDARFAIQVALDSGCVSERNVRSTLNEIDAALKGGQ